MKRVAWVLAIPLLALLPAMLSGCGIDGACACTTPPTVDPNWTPPAVGPDQAAATAARFADVPAMETDFIAPNATGPYIATATNAVAFVNSSFGTVVRMLRTDLMPNETR
jgi:hypothetical protein